MKQIKKIDVLYGELNILEWLLNETYRNPTKSLQTLQNEIKEHLSNVKSVMEEDKKYEIYDSLKERFEMFYRIIEKKEVSSSRELRKKAREQMVEVNDAIALLERKQLH